MNKNTTRSYKDGECTIIVSKDYGKWHLSISHPRRLPTYNELKEARYKYTPNLITMAQIFPPLEQYVNIHPFCLHLWQI